MTNKLKSSYDKSRMAEDIIYVFDGYNKGELSETAVNSVIEKLSWYYTEHREDPNEKGHFVFSKYKGNPYWTKKAIEYYRTKNTTDGLIHEHIIPRQLFKTSLWNHKDDLNKSKLEDAMNNKLVACVVTKEEAESLDQRFKKTMPSGESDDFFCIKDPWIRYKQMGIDVSEVTWERHNNRWKDMQIKA